MSIGIPKSHSVPSAQHIPLEVFQLFLNPLIRKFNQHVVLDREELGNHIYIFSFCQFYKYPIMHKLVDSLSLCYLWNNNQVNEISLWESWLLLQNGRKSKDFKDIRNQNRKKLNSYTWEITNSVPTGKTSGMQKLLSIL